MIMFSAAVVIVSWMTVTNDCNGERLQNRERIGAYYIHYGESRAVEGHDTRGFADCNKGTNLEDYQYENSIEVSENANRHTLELGPGNYSIAMSAESYSGNSSNYSGEISFSIPEGTASCDDCDYAGSVTISETNKEILTQWTSNTNWEVQVLEQGNSLPTLSGQFSGSSWRFTPPRAGLYHVRARKCGDCEWEGGGDQGHLIYVKLAAPSGGGLN